MVQKESSVTVLLTYHTTPGHTIETEGKELVLLSSCRPGTDSDDDRKLPHRPDPFIIDGLRRAGFRNGWLGAKSEESVEVSAG